MSIQFKAGHIVPRWCHAVAHKRRAQHLVRFGCDVSVTIKDGVVVITAKRGQAVFSVPHGIGKFGLNYGTKSGKAYSMLYIRNVNVTFE